MVFRSGILGQLECFTVERWVMRVEVQTVKMLEYFYLDGKLVTRFDWAEKRWNTFAAGPHSLRKM